MAVAPANTQTATAIRATHATADIARRAPTPPPAAGRGAPPRGQDGRSTSVPKRNGPDSQLGPLAVERQTSR